MKTLIFVFFATVMILGSLPSAKTMATKVMYGILLYVWMAFSMWLSLRYGGLPEAIVWGVLWGAFHAWALVSAKKRKNATS